MRDCTVMLNDCVEAPFVFVFVFFFFSVPVYMQAISNGLHQSEFDVQAKCLLAGKLARPEVLYCAFLRYKKESNDLWTLIWS